MANGNVSIPLGYITRGRSLLDRYKRENRIGIEDADIDPVDFVNWFFSLRGSLASGSWRGYRDAMIAKVESLPHESRGKALALLEADVAANADEARSFQRVRCVGNTRAPLPQAKHIDKPAFEEMVAAAPRFTRSESGEWLSNWLMAGIATGLRPREWAAVNIEKRGRKTWLHVMSIQTEPRLDALAFRTLDLSGASEAAMSAIERMSRLGPEWALAGQFGNNFSKCQQLCYSMSVALFPRLQSIYSLYSVRHQFITNMTAIYDIEMVVALVGDILLGMKAEEPDKRRRAWPNQKTAECPLAMPDEVGRVRKILTLHRERAAIATARKNLRPKRRQ